MLYNSWANAQTHTKEKLFNVENAKIYYLYVFSRLVFNNASTKRASANEREMSSAKGKRTTNKLDFMLSL